MFNTNGKQLAPPPDSTPQTGDQYGGVVGGGTYNGTATHCIEVDWPSAYTWSARQYRRGYYGPSAWMGSLIFESRNASGLYYQRTWNPCLPFDLYHRDIATGCESHFVHKITNLQGRADWSGNILVHADTTNYDATTGEVASNVRLQSPIIPRCSSSGLHSTPMRFAGSRMNTGFHAPLGGGIVRQYKFLDRLKTLITISLPMLLAACVEAGELRPIRFFSSFEGRVND